MCVPRTPSVSITWLTSAAISLSAATDVARVFVASSTRADALSLKVNGPLTDLDGLPFALALSQPCPFRKFHPA